MLQTTLRWSLVLCVIVCYFPGVAAAEWTSSAGSSSAGKHAAYHACPGGHWMIGMEIKYGNVGIGSVRAACRKLAENGSWTGTTVYTDWSKNDGNAESSKIKSANCPSGYVVRGFSTQISGPNIRKLKLSCVKAGGGGLTSNTSSTGWVGVTANIGAFHGCTSGKAAKGFGKRAASMLTYLRFDCGTVQTQQAGVRDVTVPGLAVYNLSRNFGFKFKANPLPGPTPICDLTFDKGQIRMEINLSPTQPKGSAGAGCKFNLFTNGPSLKNGWQLRNVKVRVLENAGCLKRYFSPSVSPSSSLRIGYILKYKASPPTFGLVSNPGHCMVHLESITLRGPSNQDWKDAF